MENDKKKKKNFAFMLKIGVNAKFFVFLEQKFVIWGGTCYNNRT